VRKMDDEERRLLKQREQLEQQQHEQHDRSIVFDTKSSGRSLQRSLGSNESVISAMTNGSHSGGSADSRNESFTKRSLRGRFKNLIGRKAKPSKRETGSTSVASSQRPKEAAPTQPSVTQSILPPQHLIQFNGMHRGPYVPYVVAKDKIETAPVSPSPATGTVLASRSAARNSVPPSPSAPRVSSSNATGRNSERSVTSSPCYDAPPKPEEIQNNEFAKISAGVQSTPTTPTTYCTVQPNLATSSSSLILQPVAAPNNAARTSAQSMPSLLYVAAPKPGEIQNSQCGRNVAGGQSDLTNPTPTHCTGQPNLVNSSSSLPSQPVFASDNAARNRVRSSASSAYTGAPMPAENQNRYSRPYVPYVASPKPWEQHNGLSQGQSATETTRGVPFIPTTAKHQYTTECPVVKDFCQASHSTRVTEDSTRASTSSSRASSTRSFLSPASVHDMAEEVGREKSPSEGYEGNDEETRGALVSDAADHLDSSQPTSLGLSSLESAARTFDEDDLAETNDRLGSTESGSMPNKYGRVVEELEERLSSMYTGHHVITESGGQNQDPIFNTDIGVRSQNQDPIYDTDIGVGNQNEEEESLYDEITVVEEESVYEEFTVIEDLVPSNETREVETGDAVEVSEQINPASVQNDAMLDEAVEVSDHVKNGPASVQNIEILDVAVDVAGHVENRPARFQNDDLLDEAVDLPDRSEKSLLSFQNDEILDEVVELPNRVENSLLRVPNEKRVSEFQNPRSPLAQEIPEDYPIINQSAHYITVPPATMSDDVSVLTMDFCFRGADPAEITRIVRKVFMKQNAIEAEDAIKKLNTKVRNEPSARRHVVKEMGVLSIKESMRKFPDNEAVQFLCCDTLKMLTSEPDLKSEMDDMDVMPIVLQCRRDHQSSHRIQDCVLAILKFYYSR